MIIQTIIPTIVNPKMTEFLIESGTSFHFSLHQSSPERISKECTKSFSPPSSNLYEFSTTFPYKTNRSRPASFSPLSTFGFLSTIARFSIAEALNCTIK